MRRSQYLTPALSRLVATVDPLGADRARLHVELGALEAVAVASRRWFAKRGDDGEGERAAAVERALRRLERARREP